MCRSVCGRTQKTDSTFANVPLFFFSSIAQVVSVFIHRVFSGSAHPDRVLLPKSVLTLSEERPPCPRPAGATYPSDCVTGCSFQFMRRQRRTDAPAPVTDPLSASLPHSLAFWTAAPPVLLSSFVAAMSGSP